MMSIFVRTTRVVVNVVAEVIAASRCAACDEQVGPTVVFCPSCATTVERSGHRGASFAYGGAVRSAIGRLKYELRADLGARLGGLIAATLAREELRVDLVAPVPLHPRRLADRGFNQSALLAAPIARRLNVPFRPRLLVRSRDTPQQAALDRSERLLNMRGAFVVRERARVQDARILLVDDVRTTGATLEACASVLRDSGARAILTHVLALS